jgi:GMP synthase PP-ATPase subunit
VQGTKDAVDSDGKPIYQSLAQGTIFPDVVQALQAAIAKIEVLETKVATLEAG